MKKLFSAVLALVLACSLLTGCTVETQEEKVDSGSNQYYLYYVNKDETKVVKERYQLEQESAEFMLQDFTGILNAQEGSGDNLALLPSGVQLVTYRLNESLLELEFNSDYSKMSRAREILVRAGVARTFLQIPGVTGIKIFIESEELKDSKGQAVGVIDGNTFVEMWGSDKDAYRYDTFTLYFTDKTGEHLVAEQRNVYYKRILPRERVILEQLAKGPMVKGHYPTIPQETEILGVEVSDDVCYVDFSSAFSDSGIDIPVNTMIYSVVNSLLDTAAADKVQISVEGDTEATLSDGTSLYSLFSKNTDLVLKEDQSE
ncbi:GerMN domain-containing protein [Blautia glucerasea]|uniref:GerMN domain-containing protein n=1 Tax=Blautia glucerasea TaxID=536633 RepID=UPI00156FB784|nr:GerMN domain-containing protein [Blautia glucerasea]NSL02397.1 GerMN domain-containing protein [Blautia glucerasea]